MKLRDDVMLRAVEVGFSAVVTIALLVAVTGGWFTSATQTFSDWYASEVSGILDIDVVSTTVNLPQLDRADLPLPPANAVPRTGNSAGPTPSDSSN